ncbi:hypothetical protein Tco_1045849, partial [Tanacetum coccineum]
EEEVDELYRDVNVNLEGRDTEMIDASPTIIQTTQVIEDTHVIITPVNPKGQQQSSSVSSAIVSNMLNSSPDTDQVKEHVKAQVSKILLKVKKTVNEQLEVEVMTCSSNESKTSHAIAANLSELELKKIPIDKMESNKCRDDEDKDEKPSTGSNQGSKRRKAGKELESASAPKEKTSKTTGKSTEGSKSHHKSADKFAQAEEPMHTAKDLEEPAHQEFVTGDIEDKLDEETSQRPNWFQKPAKPPTPDHDWNKTLPAAHGPIQPWLTILAQKEDTRESFNELMDNPLDFSAFIMKRLKVDTLTLELLAGLTFKLMKGSCKSQQYPHDLCKPLPLIPNSRGRQVIPFDHFINNDLAYLSGGVSSRKYTNSVTKTKAADYGHIKWIEDLVLNRMESARDVYSKRRIIAVTKLQIVKWHNYKHLDWITVRRDDDKLYKFKEGNFNRLRVQDIEDMLLLLVQGNLTNLTVEERLAFNVSLSDLKRREAYTAYSNPICFIYQNKDKKNRLMRIDELHKFSDGTLNDVQTALNDRLKGIHMKY